MMKKWIALFLSIVLVCSLLTACGKTEVAEEAPVTTPVEEPVEVPVEEPVEEPAEEPEEVPAEEPVEEPVEEPEQTAYPEAVAVMTWLNGLDDAAIAHPSALLSGAQAAQMLAAAGLQTCSLDAAASTVNTGDFLIQALQMLNAPPMDSILDAARVNHLLNGLQLDAAANITVEEAAQVLRNTLIRSADLTASLGLTYTVLPDYPHPFNAVSGQWIVNATGEAVTQPMTAAPVAVFDRALTWCEALTYLGYTAEGNNSMVTLQNSWTGEEYSIKYEKCHWDGDGSGNIHSGCTNEENITNGVDSLMEIYQISENEYRVVFKVNFLGFVSDKHLVLFGYYNETWGPWGIETLPEDGYYIINYYWNAYGVGEGFDVVQPAETMIGTLESINDKTAVIDGQEYLLSFVFNYGSMMAKAPTSVGKQFTWYLDQTGEIVGCGEYFGAA